MNSVLGALALVIAALLAASVPAAVSVADVMDDNGRDDGVVTVSGTVTAFMYGDERTDDEDDDERDGDWDKPRLEAFVIDNETIVTFGPWWYWMYMKINITDIVHIDDEVNVTGEMHEEDDGTWILEACYIENLTTDEDLTIKGEGRPPWAGGPKALEISPWPPSNMEE
ncbi:MAG TPA: hypothetical protein VGB78_12290 [Thermoplasmata archaeon]|jgi:hypothetical protein